MMQNIPENYYELLDVSPLASPQEIEQAFSRAKALYDENSEAVYSLFSPGEREKIMSRIFEAYETLSDPLKRKAYDKGLHMIAGSRDRDTAEVDVNELLTKSNPFANETTGSEPVAYTTTAFKAPLPVERSTNPMVMEQYRILFTNIEHTKTKVRTKTFAITSSVKGEGKSATSLNLAYVAAAQFKKKAVLIECDLRKPSALTGMLEGEDQGGLIDVLKGEIDISVALRRVQNTNLWLLTAGVVANCNVPEFLNSHNMRTLLERLKSEFDYVILDCPPIMGLVDMKIISKIVDSVIIVVRAGVAPKDIVAKAVQTLSDSNVIGLVLNDVETNLSKYNYY